jgi:MFS family permease
LPAFESDAAAQYLPLHKVVSVGLGNALEFYDFFAFSYFAIQIGHTFFPASLTVHGLLFSLASFAVGSITRPLGGIIIGRYGDRVGRKPAMLLSFGLMGVGLLGLALTPSYAQIGAAAPVLLLVFRLIQGVGVGGEVGPTTAFLIEVAPPHRRGLYGSLQYGTQYFAVILSGFVGFLLSANLSPEQLDSWGWRVAFLLGTVVVPIGLFIRRTLPETLDRRVGEDSDSASARLSPRLIVPALAILTAMTMSGYTVSYMITYVQDTLRLSANSAFGAPFAEGLSYMIVAALSGLASDRFGRLPITRIGLALLLIAALPCYIAMARWPSAFVVYGATAVLSGLGALWCNPALVNIVESLPARARARSFGLVYSLATTIFGGCTQFMLKWLIDVTRSPLAPAWYLVGSLSVAACAMLWVRESAPCRRMSLRGADE